MSSAIDPAGRIRLIAPPIVLSTVLSPKLEAFTRAYPDVVLDITSEDDTRGDLVARRYDAGIHLGEFLQRDMTAVRVTREQRAAVVAAPALLRRASEAEDTARHHGPPLRAIPHGPGWARSTAGSSRSAASRSSVSASGPVIVSDAQFMIRAALDGVGLAYILEDYVAEHIARGDTRARPRGLVPALRGLLSLLPEPSSPVAGAAGTRGGTPSLTTALRLTDRLNPLDVLPTDALLNGEVRHRRGGRRPVPMHHSWQSRDDVPSGWATFCARLA